MDGGRQMDLALKDAGRRALESVAESGRIPRYLEKQKRQVEQKTREWQRSTRGDGLRSQERKKKGRRSLGAVPSSFAEQDERTKESGSSGTSRSTTRHEDLH